MQASVFMKYSFFPFTSAFRVFSLAQVSKSPLRFPNSKVSVLGVHFHCFGVNGRLKWREKYSFLTEIKEYGSTPYLRIPQV